MLVGPPYSLGSKLAGQQSASCLFGPVFISFVVVRKRTTENKRKEFIDCSSRMQKVVGVVFVYCDALADL